MIGHPLPRAAVEGGMVLCAAPGGTRSEWALEPGTVPRLSWRSGARDPAHLLAALEAVLAGHPHVHLDTDIAPELRDAGVVSVHADGPLAHRDTFWQHAARWHGRTRTPHALRHVVTGAARHPMRGPKPEGTVYRRHIPWLGQDLTLRTVDPERDLTAFHRWMNDPFVAHFWQEEGDLVAHRAYLDRLAGDPHTVALVMALDDRPFGYAEAYWVKEDRLAPFCDATDFDRGWHVLVGEAACRGRAHVSAWMPSLAHHLFLDDPRTQRVFVEPRADNDRMLRNLARNGYAQLKEFDFPHKRAMLCLLLRERFFGESLWQPRAPSHEEIPCKSTT